MRYFGHIEYRLGYNTLTLVLHFSHPIASLFVIDFKKPQMHYGKSAKPPFQNFL